MHAKWNCHFQNSIEILPSHITIYYQFMPLTLTAFFSFFFLVSFQRTGREGHGLLASVFSS